MGEAGHSRFYYNATIQNTETARKNLQWRPATFAEARVAPLLPETTNWRVGLARLTAFGATGELPLWEAILQPGSLTTTPYSFTLRSTYTTSAGAVLAARSSRAIVQWFPQHVGDPDKYWTCSTYQHMCNVFNAALATATADLNAQMNATTGTTLFTSPAPTLSWNGDVFVITLDPLYVPGLVAGASGANVETRQLFQNSACSGLFPFPYSANYDVDGSSARGEDATVLLDVAKVTPVVTTAGVTTGAVVSQEWDATGAWSPYVALTLLATSIPVAPEFVGTTTVTSGGDVNATVGGNSRLVLADIDLLGTSAHDYLTGISYTPDLIQYTPMQRGRLASMNFSCQLRRRDGTYDEWDVPSYGAIDIKLVFEYGS